MFGVLCNLHYLLNRAGGRIQRDLNKSPETTEADGLELGEGCSEKQQGERASAEHIGGVTGRVTRRGGCAISRLPHVSSEHFPGRPGPLPAKPDVPPARAPLNLSDQGPSSLRG